MEATSGSWAACSPRGSRSSVSCRSSPSRWGPRSSPGSPPAWRRPGSSSCAAIPLFSGRRSSAGWGGPTRQPAAAPPAGGRRTRGALVVAEVALSLVLLLGAALMIESLGVLQRDDPGCDPHGVLTFVLGLSQQQYP